MPRVNSKPKAKARTKSETQSKTQVQPVPRSKTLVHPDGRQYDFHPQPQDEEVAVVVISRYQFSRVVMPRNEALYLWQRLLKQGFGEW